MWDPNIKKTTNDYWAKIEENQSTFVSLYDVIQKVKEVLSNATINIDSSLRTLAEEAGNLGVSYLEKNEFSRRDGENLIDYIVVYGDGLYLENHLLRGRVSQ